MSTGVPRTIVRPQPRRWHCETNSMSITATAGHVRHFPERPAARKFNKRRRARFQVGARATIYRGPRDVNK